MNSGFLYGPFIPVFGFGGLIIHYLYEPLAVLPYPEALELVTGSIMHRAYRSMLWDYSEHRFNLGGYICLRFSLYRLGLDGPRARSARLNNRQDGAIRVYWAPISLWA